MKRTSLYVIGFPNGKLYIGITTGIVKRRFRRHCQSTKVVGWAIRKYGSENCKLMVLHRGLSWKEAGNLERWYIQELETGIKQNGYNVAGGGGGTLGVPLSLKGRRAVSITNRRRWLESPEEMQAVVAKAHAAVRGKKHTGDRLQKSRAAQQAATIAAIKANRGKKHTGDRLRKSQATVAKARRVRSMQVVSEETRKKMSEAQKQAWERRRARCAITAISA